MSASQPQGVFNAHWFQFFNAISFQIMMGAPIILFAKSLGASSTVIGIVASFTPLMTVFQLPAARFLDRFSYREFVLAGWGVRSIFIFIVAFVPILSFLDNPSKMAVLLASLFLYNLLRGITSSAWMPWITALIPEGVRGRFLSVDQFFIQAGSLLSLAISAWLMAGQVESWEYSLLFLVSATGAWISLLFIKKIPEVQSAEVIRRSSAPVPWLAMLRYGPFLRLLFFNLLYVIVVGSLGVFTVEYLRASIELTVSTVLVLSAFSFVGALMILPVCGMVIDQTGSKPLLAVATGIFFFVIAGWFLVASGILPPVFALFAGLNFFSGCASSSFNLANTRYAMATMPEMGRNHFFAMFIVITSLGLGASPVVWGLLLDALGSLDVTTGILTWKRHSVFFLALLGINILTLIAIRILKESRGTVHPSPASISAIQRGD